MAKLKFEIVTPEKRMASGEADEVIAPGTNGLFGVRPGHAPLLSLLEAGVLTVKDSANSSTYFIAGGFAEVSAQSVRVLADSAEATQAIDVTASSKRLEAAEKALQTLSPVDVAAEAQRKIIEVEKKRQVAQKLPGR